MKQFLKKTGLFISLIPIIYIGVLAILVLLFPDGPDFLNINFKNTYGHSHTRFQEVKTTKNIDILFIGPSTTYMGFDTRIFENAGYEVFNLGSSAQTPIQTHVLLKRYLDQLAPKLVVYNPHPETFTIEGTEAATDLFSNDTIDRNLVNMLFSYLNPIAVNTFAFSFLAEKFEIKKSYTEPLTERNDTYISGGYVSRNLSISNRMSPQTEEDDQAVESWVPLDSQTKAFEKIISLLKQSDTGYVLVQPPVHSDYYLNSAYGSAEVKKYFEQFGKYIDFNLLIELEDSIHMADYTVHLNQEGVEKFNNYILDNSIFNLKETTNPSNTD